MTLTSNAQRRVAWDQIHPQHQSHLPHHPADETPTQCGMAA